MSNQVILTQNQLPKVTLPTEKSLPKYTLEQKIILLYGRPKIGKTQWCAEIPDAFFLATEPGHGYVSVYKADVPSWLHFRAYVSELKKQDKHKTIVIDTASSLVRLCSSYVVERKRAKDSSIETLSDLGFGKGTDMVKTAILEELLPLAAMGFTIIFVTHEKSKKDKDGNEIGVKPDFSDSFANALEGMCDFILHMTYGSVFDEEKKQNVKKRVIFSRSGKTEGDGGSRLGATFPSMLSPTFQAFEEALKNADPQTYESKENQ